MRSSPWSVFTGTAEANATGIHHYLRPLLIGADPLKISTLMRQIEKALVGHTEGKAAVEMALFDIVGKHLGVPVAQLLGGYYRSHVPLSVSIANPDFEEDLAFAKRLVAQGVNIFKVKTGFSSPQGGSEATRASAGRLAPDRRPAGRLQPGARSLGCDPPDQGRGSVPANLHRAARQARPARGDGGNHSGHRYADHGGRERVQPGRGDRDGARRDRRSGQHQDHEVRAAWCGRARSPSIAEAAGITAYGGTMFEGGLAIAAGLHMVAATPNIALGAEFYTSTWVMGVDILKSPIEIDNGMTRVPTGPGLGVDIDERQGQAHQHHSFRVNATAARSNAHGHQQTGGWNGSDRHDRGGIEPRGGTARPKRRRPPTPPSIA